MKSSWKAFKTFFETLQKQPPKVFCEKDVLKFFTNL